MDIISVLVFSCLASAVFTYGLGLSVYAKNPGSATHRLFLLTMLVASYWAAGEFMIWQSTGYDAVRFWLKASSFWTLSVVLTLHFILAFTRHPLAGRKNLKYLLVFLYLPAILVSLAGIFTDSLFTVVSEPGYGYIYVPVSDSPVYIAESVMFTVVMAFSLWVGFSSWKKQAPGRIRVQSLLLSLGFVIVILCGALSALILPHFGIHIPNTVFPGIVCFSGIVAYAMIRQGLFTLSPESAAANIIQTMPDGLLLVDTAGRIIAANTSAEVILRREKGGLIGQPAEAVLPGESARAALAAIADQGTICDLEAVLDTPEYRVVSIAGSRITSPDGEAAGSVLIFHDITGRKASERSLRLAKEKLSLLSQLTRHDITNLVTALNGYILLLSEKTSDPGSAEYIAACSGILERIDAHLQFSRQYEEIGKHEPAWQSMEAVAGRAIGDLAPTKATVSCSHLPFRIYADPLLVKVVYNLLENAIRHGGGKLDRVTVAAEEREGRELVVVIEDNGDGVPAGDKERIFDHGFGKNTGLGLTLSREILAVTGIRLVETGVPGTGARFEMHVPPQAWRKG